MYNSWEKFVCQAFQTGHLNPRSIDNVHTNMAQNENDPYTDFSISFELMNWASVFKDAEASLLF